MEPPTHTPNGQTNVNPTLEQSQSLKQDVSVAVVSMNYRYAGAWNEVNARIAQRQNALSIFVTLGTAIVSILFASRQTSNFNKS